LELEAILHALCAAVPAAIGAVLCDFEGETVVAALGTAAPPAAALARAQDHVPRAIALHMPLPAFLMRLAGAEPCALLRLFSEAAAHGHAGGLAGFTVRYAEVELLVERLPEDFYLVLAVRRPAVSALAQRAAREAVERLRPHLL
jgi:hypothetical protein